MCGGRYSTVLYCTYNNKGIKTNAMFFFFFFFFLLLRIPGMYVSSYILYIHTYIHTYSTLPGWVAGRAMGYHRAG